MLRLAEFISRNYSGKVLEVGIGNFTAVAEELASNGLSVVATDIVKRRVPKGIEFHVDDIRHPKLEIYGGVKLVYSIRPPPELVKYILRVSMAVEADCIIKPLYGDYFDGELVNYRGLPFYLFRRGWDD
jgi:hypothetical protein